MNAVPDNLDRRLLALLQQNAREPVSHLARKLNVARTTVLARINKLENSGIISGYSVVLGKSVSENALHASVGISLQPKAGPKVLKAISAMPEVYSLWSVSGEFDYLALLRAQTSQQLDNLLDQIGLMEGVNNTHTSILLSKKLERSGG